MKSYQLLWKRLTDLYDAGEAQAIVRMLLDVRFHLTLADIVSDGLEQLSAENQVELEEMMSRLEKAEPVQYVLGQADFCGHTFHVEQGVLIPRPETEELCWWIVEEESKKNRRGCEVLDIGTGSGCIAVTMALEIEAARVTAWDISEEALRIARDNAGQLGAHVSFVCQDALQPPADKNLWDIIVSNPPYIAQREQAAMHHNVMDYEPQQALFVSDEDPLLFYRAISHYAAKALRKDGTLYFEINPLYARDTCGMLESLGFQQVCLRDDSFGKQRFIQAKAPKTAQ